MNAAKGDAGREGEAVNPYKAEVVISIEESQRWPKSRSSLPEPRHSKRVRFLEVRHTTVQFTV